MKLDDLRNKLKSYGIPEHYYSLNGEDKMDAFILVEDYNIWRFYYFSERGSKHNENVFVKESLACEYAFKIIKKAFDFQG
jgi:hypothetical protein